MNTLALRDLIQRAQRQETTTGDLARQLEARLLRLHPSIQLGVHDHRGVLTRFVERYVEQVPAMLEAVARVAEDAGLEAQVKPLLATANTFFVGPGAPVERKNLGALLDAAYLAHRLVEEINDRYITHLGRPLTPLDTTVANLIAHQLIGERYANDLDRAVAGAVAGQLGAEVFERGSVRAYRLHVELQEDGADWPELARQLGVTLALDLAEIAENLPRPDDAAPATAGSSAYRAH